MPADRPTRPGRRCARVVLALLRDGRTRPETWDHAERAAVTRLHSWAFRHGARAWPALVPVVTREEPHAGLAGWILTPDDLDQLRVLTRDPGNGNGDRVDDPDPLGPHHRPPAEPDAAEDRFAEDLILRLRRLGDTYGPLGVAIAAATLTDPRVLIAQIDPDGPEPDRPAVVDEVDLRSGSAQPAGSHLAVPPVEREARDYFAGEYRPVGHLWPDTPDGARLQSAHVAFRAGFARGVDYAPPVAPPDGYEANLDALRAEVARLSGLLDDASREAARADEAEAELARRRSEWDQRSAEGRQQVARLVEENDRLREQVASMTGKRNRAREHAVRNESERDALQRQLDEPSPHPIEEDPRRPHPDSWPDDAVLLRYVELRRLVALHLERYADARTARAMLDGDVPLRVSEVLDQ